MLKLFETLPLISLDCCHELNCDDKRVECDDTEKEQQLAKDLMSPKLKCSGEVISAVSGGPIHISCFNCLHCKPWKCNACYR